MDLFQLTFWDGTSRWVYCEHQQDVALTETTDQPSLVELRLLIVGVLRNNQVFFNTIV